MKSAITLLLVFTFSFQVFAQIDEDYFKENPEVYFKFSITGKSELNRLTNIISIDNVDGSIVYAYANEREFIEFEKLNYSYTVLTHPGKLIRTEISSNIESILDWNVYPTYDAYINMMYQFQADYPNICEIVDAGNTVQGRKILFAKISDNISVKEPEPQFMYTSSMHGDETTGYVLMLRLIDSLLTSYGTNSRITNLVNNVEIWINPLANPDGTYHGGNSTVYGATRYNYNGYDLNRNFPDPVYGVNSNQQIETARFRAIAESNNFSLCANFHGGTEVVNYPWDTWTNTAPDFRHHPDETWYQYISHLYADTCQAHSPSTYMNGYDDGTTNGGNWYIVHGGRQDYTNYYRNGREVTIEISDTKLLSPSLLPAHWEYNKRSFLNYMESVLYGVKGFVTDTIGNPVLAKITVLNHDVDNSHMYSDSSNGFYLRMLAPGTYSVKFESPEHYDTVLTNVTVSSYSSITELNVEMRPLNPVPVELASFNFSVNERDVQLYWTTASELNNLGFEIRRKRINEDFKSIGFIDGNGTTSEINNYSFIDNNVNAGDYVYRLMQKDLDGTLNFLSEVKVKIQSPADFVLDQNYPNPFNPVTTIHYSLPENNFVNLKVYDMLGNQVRTLIDKYQDAGNHSIVFDASELTTGVYFYQLTAGKYSAIGKMILLK